MGQHWIDFNSHDSGPRRANQLVAMADRIVEHGKRIKVLEQAVATPGGGGEPDPGDLRVYFENGLI